MRVEPPSPTPNDSSEDDEEPWHDIILEELFKKWWIVFVFLGIFFGCVGVCARYCCPARRVIVIRQVQPGQDIV